MKKKLSSISSCYFRVILLHFALAPTSGLRCKAVADAYVASMESEGKLLRDAKLAVESALSSGSSVKSHVENLDAANETYRRASQQVRKASVVPKAKATSKAKAKAKAAAAAR